MNGRKKFFTYFLSAAVMIPAGLAMSGCAREVIAAEVFQQPVDGHIYTRCNLWVNNPEAISSRNIQRGKILPIGTEVFFTSVTNEEINFTDAEGDSYRILYDNSEMMVPVEQYLRQTFTLTPPEELLAPYSPETVEKIKKGVVMPGMTGEEVLLTCGYPIASRTPSLQNSSWLYFVDDQQTIRIVFRGDKVYELVRSEN